MRIAASSSRNMRVGAATFLRVLGRTSQVLKLVMYAYRAIAGALLLPPTVFEIQRVGPEYRTRRCARGFVPLEGGLIASCVREID